MDEMLMGWITRSLTRVGILVAAVRIRELAMIARFALQDLAGRTQAAAPDGLPVPPRHLIHRVAGSSELDWFLRGGLIAAETIRDVLDRHSVRLGDLTAILDFGCGCGRVLRYWPRFTMAEIHGTDCDSRLVDWCRHRLAFADCRTNALFPPLGYSEQRFDLVYALSVFTHLPEALQHRWMDELFRVLKPGGYLIITTHGEHYLETLTREQREAFRSSTLVVWNDGAAGTNYCSAYHPFDYVRTRLSARFDLVDFIPMGARGNPHQDLYLLRRPPAYSSPTGKT